MNKIITKLPQIHLYSNPISVQINITNRCINRCIMCKKYLWPANELSYNILLKLVKDLIEMKVESLIFSGGEVLLYKKLLNVVKYIKENSDIEISIITTALTDKAIDFVELSKNLNRIYVSLDAIDENIYKKIRGNGDVEKVKETIKLFKNNNPNTKVWITKSKLNENHIKDIEEWCNENNINYNIFPVHTYTHLKTEDSFKELPKFCHYSYSFLIVDSSGECYNCCKILNDNGLFEERLKSLCLGNVNNESIIDIWNSEKAIHIKEQIHNKRNKFCASCDRAYISNKYYSWYLENKDKRIFL